MLEELKRIVDACNLKAELEEEEEIGSPQDAFRAFAVNFDIRPFLEIIRKLEGPGVQEILEELDVDTCEPEFIIFFLSDVYEELPDDEKREIRTIFESLKEDLSTALAALALVLLLRKALGSLERVEETLAKLAQEC